MKSVFIAALAVLSAGSAIAQDAPQGGPASGVPVLEGAQAAPDCGALSVPADKAFCVSAPLASMQSVGEAYIGHLEGQGWQIVMGDANYLVFAKPRGDGQCDGLQMLAFYDDTAPDTPTTPGYLAFGTTPPIPCTPRAADAAPAAQ